eukprot:scaffold2794_cov100-Cylindrotheca_fusiformis.AAC.9
MSNLLPISSLSTTNVNVNVNSNHKRRANVLRGVYWWLLYPTLLLTTFLSLLDLLLWNNNNNNNFLLLENNNNNNNNNNDEISRNAIPEIIMPIEPKEADYPGNLLSSSSNNNNNNFGFDYEDSMDYYYDYNEHNNKNNQFEIHEEQTSQSLRFTQELKEDQNRLVLLMQQQQQQLAKKKKKKESSNNNNNKVLPKPYWNLAKTNPTSRKVIFGSPTISIPSRFINNINNDPTTTITTVKTVILVMSAPDNFIRRQAIRKTWKQNHTNNNTDVVFIIGQQQEEEENVNNNNIHFLQQEQDLYQDLIEIPMMDHYRLLPEKVIQSYSWALDTYPNIEWLVKVDDDNYVNISKLQRYLIKYNSNIPILIGKIVPKSKVARVGKWAEEMEYYPYDYYPYWPQGSCGHVISKIIATYIVTHSSNLHRYQGEDVSIGIWLDEIQHDENDFRNELTYIQAESIMTFDGFQFCFESQYLIVGHDLSTDAIYQCYQQQQLLQQAQDNKEQIGNNNNNAKKKKKKVAWIDSPAYFEYE